MKDKIILLAGEPFKILSQNNFGYAVENLLNMNRHMIHGTVLNARYHTPKSIVVVRYNGPTHIVSIYKGSDSDKYQIENGERLPLRVTYRNGEFQMTLSTRDFWDFKPLTFEDLGMLEILNTKLAVRPLGGCMQDLSTYEFDNLETAMQFMKEFTDESGVGTELTCASYYDYYPMHAFVALGDIAYKVYENYDYYVIAENLSNGALRMIFKTHNYETELNPRLVSYIGENQYPVEAWLDQTHHRRFHLYQNFPFFVRDWGGSSSICTHYGEWVLDVDSEFAQNNFTDFNGNCSMY